MFSCLKANIPTLNQISNPWHLFKLAFVLRKRKPDLVFSIAGYPSLLTILADKFLFVYKPLIVREITVRFKFMQMNNVPLFSLRKSIYRVLFSWLDHLVAPSPEIIQE